MKRFFIAIIILGAFGVSYGGARVTYWLINNRTASAPTGSGVAGNHRVWAKSTTDHLIDTDSSNVDHDLTAPLSSAPLADSSYTHAISLGGVAASTWLKIAAGDPSRYVDLYGTYHSSTDTGDPGGANDNVACLGQNLIGGGAAAIVGRIAMGVCIESKFTAAQRQGEMHLESVDPSGTATRLFSAEAHQDGTTAVYMASTGGQIGSGISSSAPTSFSWGPTETDVKSVDQFKRLRLDNSNLYLESGTTNSPSTTITLGGTGDISVQSTRGFFGFTGTTQLEYQNGAIFMQDADGNTTVYVINDDIDLISGGTLDLRMLPNLTEVWQPFEPHTDQTGVALGAASRRFTLGYFGAPVANRPTCDSTTRGGMMPVFAANGASDTLQVCMKAAADTYAWRTIFTAP